MDNTSKSPAILLVQPPGSYADMPTLAIACLQGYLKAHAISNIRVWDSNLEFLSYLLSPESLSNQEERIRSGLAAGNTEEFRDRTLFSLPYLRESIHQAVETFHSPTLYYDIPSFNRAMTMVSEALNVYNTENDPIEYSFRAEGFYTKVDRTKLPFSTLPLIQFAKDPKSWGWLRKFLESKKAEIAQNGPYDLVGLTCPNPQQFLPALVLAHFFKETGIARKTVLGGSFVSVHREAICGVKEAYDLFDYIVTFEGEQSLLEIVEAISAGKESNNIPGVHCISNGEIVHNPPQSLRNLSLLPTPDFSGMPLSRYWTPEPVLPAYSTRGCYFDVCSFCNHHENYFGNFRVRSTDRVIEDLKTYEQLYGASKVFFVDELLVPKQHVEIARRIAEEKLSTKWYCHSRVEKQFTKENLKILAAGGVTLLHVGMESANTRVLGLMKKGYERPDVLRFLQDISDIPISMHLNTIRSFPGEQPEEYVETLETAWEFARAGDYIHLYPFGFMEGAPISREGNPYIVEVQRNKESNLDEDLSFTLKDIRTPTSEEERKILQLRTALSSFATLNEVFPKDCCWAAHLLYVSRYREKGMGHVLDQPISELTSDSKILKFFSESNRFAHWQLEPSERNVFHSSLILNLDTFSNLTVSNETTDLLKSFRKSFSPSEFPDPTELYRLVKAGVLLIKEKDEG